MKAVRGYKQQIPDTGVEVRIMGEETNADDPLEAWTQLAGVPRAGDQISVWTGDEEVYLTVELVVWPAWEYEHDPGVQAPVVFLRREGGRSDDEWRGLFRALDAKLTP